MGAALWMLLEWGCWGRNIPYEGGDTGTLQAATCNDSSETGLTITGLAQDLETAAAAPAGLCVTAVDPIPALTGGDPTPLAAGRTCADGRFVVPGIEAPSSVATFLVVDDCTDATDDRYARIATGVVGDDYAGFVDGDVLEGARAIAITAAYLATLEQDLAAAGYAGPPLLETGFLAGPVVDADDQPLSSAVVSCGGCTVFYLDADPSDGVFMTGGQPNTATDAVRDALFLIPAAGVGQYAADDGGAHQWEPLLVGSFAEYGVFIQLRAVP